MKKEVIGSSGFSLIELIITIGILVLLLSLLIPNLIVYMRIAQEKSDLNNARSIYSAAQTYVAVKKADTGMYPNITGDDILQGIIDEELINRPGNNVVVSIIYIPGSAGVDYVEYATGDSAIQRYPVH